jgi:hypothetical protein
MPADMFEYDINSSGLKNHTNKFWAELNRIVGDAKAKDKELNQYKMF